MGSQGFEELYFYAAMTEGISKAWISNLCEAKDTATAIGAYTAFASLATMLASAIAGLVWQLTTPAMTFWLAAAGGAISVCYFFILGEDRSSNFLQT